MDKKSAWIYCRIDAPEDVHGALKGQYERLETYATQMGFPLSAPRRIWAATCIFDRPGLQEVLEAAKAGNFHILLVDSVNRIGRDMSKTTSFTAHRFGCGSRKEGIGFSSSSKHLLWQLLGKGKVTDEAELFS